MVRLLRAGALRVDPLSEDVAYRLGILLAKSGPSDVVDAHVALIARRLKPIVLTSDLDDLTALDDTLKLVTVWAAPSACMLVGATDGNFWPKVAMYGTSATDPPTSP